MKLPEPPKPNIVKRLEEESAKVKTLMDAKDKIKPKEKSPNGQPNTR